MSKEFYSFIAKKINSYFQNASSEKTILKGETFCLKLDNEEMVSNVAIALESLVKSDGNIGEFVLNCGKDVEYKTFTIKLMNDEVIIAPQINGITSDFLCATLRNFANKEKKTILLISSYPIDSAISGSRNMSSNGMPFYGEELMEEIKKMVNESTQLTLVEKRILYYELQGRDTDVFIDKSSLYEYGDLLAIMNVGRLQSDCFPRFRIFYIDGKSDYLNEGEKAVDKKIKDNNELFERIDRCNRFGSYSDLTKDFDESFIEKIKKEQMKDTDNWSKSFTYSDMLKELEKHKFKVGNPLKIEDSDILLYGESINEKLQYDYDWIMRDEGTQKIKKRQKNIIVFNSDKRQHIHIRINCDTKIIKKNVEVEDIIYEKKDNCFIFELNPVGVYFKKIKLSDKENDINYVFKVCVVDLPAKYMLSVIKHCYTLDFKKKSDIRIKLSGIGNELIFNDSASEEIKEKLDNNASYCCAYNERLHLISTDDELLNYSTGIRLHIDFAGVDVPFIIFPDEIRSLEITGKKIFKEKYASKKSFEFVGEKIYDDTQEYFAKTNLIRELRLEKTFIDEKIIVGKCKRFYDTEQVVIENEYLEQNQFLIDAYLEFLDALKQINSLPTLAHLSENLFERANNYINAFMSLYSSLKDGETLSPEQINALYIGTIVVGNDAEEILLTPFHPINVAYQITLTKEEGMKEVSDVIVERLTSLNLIPYFKRKKSIYKVSNQLNSLEWKYYAPVENKKYRGNWRFVPRLVEEKITEFLKHFKCIFSDINNKKIKINIINMGDCTEVFNGIAQFFIHSVNKNIDVDDLVRFELHIYSDNIIDNVFSKIREYGILKKYLDAQKLEVASGVSMNTLEGIFSKNVECYFHKESSKEFNYAHLTFYEMESEITSEQASMVDIETGVSLGGILSGIPSSKYSTKYRTGYGAKYAPNNQLISLANLYNSLIQVESSGNPYYKGLSLSTQIDEISESKMSEIYNASNWVVFVEPKVDLDFFVEKAAMNDLLIIHYSDQYTTSSGYDAITVTHKSKQYSLVIQDYLKTRGVNSTAEDINGIINLFNAVNGDWLLRLISSKRMPKESTFSREKISIVAAIKYMLAFLKHYYNDMIWIPISLEEMLRVSGGVGLSKGDSVLSAKNLGFENGPTSDDLLFVGVEKLSEMPKVYLYPTEVKTGINGNDVINKAYQQVYATDKGINNAFAQEDDITKKVNRNFLIQLIITSCKKMKAYHVDDSQEWDVVLDLHREALLNERYIISDDIQEAIGKGAVLSFSSGISLTRMNLREDGINLIEVPEKMEFDLILDSVDEIEINTEQKEDYGLPVVGECSVSELTGDIFKETNGNIKEYANDDTSLINGKEDNTVVKNETLIHNNEFDNEENMGIKILFGTNEQDGKDVIWKPNNTEILFHTNTGIIGTMGTGKTQFTKSIITQLYSQQKYNIDEKDLGILIFDYKGDYNESKKDFVDITNAVILKPYHLPFNPLALTRTNVFKPLLPLHTANAFKDTISKVYNLGTKQQATLLQCIMDTYSASGIDSNNQITWDNEAPTFNQVYQRYINDEEIKKGDSLDAALGKLNMFQLFEANPSSTKALFDLLKGVVVIDLSGYDTDIQNLIVAITLDLFYSQMQALGSSKMSGNYRQLTKIILVDEADNFMSQGFSTLKKILKEGREFGVGTILSTQSLKHFGNGEDDYSKYILTWIVHNVSDLKYSDIDFVFKTEAKSNESINLFNRIKSLNKHHSIIKIGTNKPVYLHDKAFWELYNEIKNN